MSTGKERAARDAALEPVVKAMNKGMNHYNRPAVDGEFNLLQCVREDLVAAVGESSVASIFDTDRHIQDAKGKNAYAQQFHLNQYFSLQFMQVAEKDLAESQLARYSLLTDARPDAWYKIFQQKVLPTFLHFKLPVVI